MAPLQEQVCGIPAGQSQHLAPIIALFGRIHKHVIHFSTVSAAKGPGAKETLPPNAAPSALKCFVFRRWLDDPPFAAANSRPTGVCAT